MEKTIGLQFAGCAETGFDSLLSINWTGRNLSDFMPREEYYADPVAYFARIDSEYQTYEAVICKFEGLDLRHSAFQIAIRIPVGYRIAEAATGKIVSPAAVLRPILTKVMSEHLKSFENTYEYRGRQIPTFVPADYSSMLDRYRLEPQWGPMVDMNGTRPVYINGLGSEDIDVKMLAIPYIARLAQASTVEIGGFSSSVATTALTDDELHPEAEIQVRVCHKTGNIDNRVLTATPMHLHSENFGYSTEIYNNVGIVLQRDTLLAQFRKGNYTSKGDGYKVEQFPSKGIVSVQFCPQLRRKAYEIQLKGNGVADRQNEIFEQLLYNANKINNRKVAFEGESIVQFESMSAEQLCNCFSLTRLAKFKIDKVRRDGNVISITLEAKEEPKPIMASENMAPAMRKSSTNQKTLLIRYQAGAKLANRVDVVLTQYLSPEVESVSVFRKAEVLVDESGRYSVVTFAELAGNPRIEVRIGRPSLYKGEPRQGDDKYDYVVDMCAAKGAVSRYFSIFKWREMDGNWPIWRDVTIAAAAILLALLCYFAGVFTSGMGVLNEIRDTFVKPEPVEIVAPEEKVPVKEAPIEVKVQPVDSVETEKAENDSIDTIKPAGDEDN